MNPPRMEPGATVRLRSGPFKGRLSTLVRSSSTQRGMWIVDIGPDPDPEEPPGTRLVVYYHWSHLELVTL